MLKKLISTLALGLCLGGVARADTDIKFTLGWKTQGSDAPFLLAMQKGYFKEEGLNVTIDQGEGSAATVTRIMSGAYDAGFGDINAIIQNAATRPNEVPVMVYQALEQAALRHRQQEGKQHHQAGRSGRQEARRRTGHAHHPPRQRARFDQQGRHDQGRNREHGPQPAGADADQGAILTARFVFNITAWFNLINNRQDPAKDYNWLSFGDYGLDLYANGMMVSQKLVKENPKAVEGLVRAVNKATREIAGNSRAGIEAIMTYDNLAKEELELARMKFSYENLIISPEVDRLGLGDVDDARLARSIDIVAEGYQLPSKPKPENVFSRQFLPSLAERKLVYKID